MSDLKEIKDLKPAQSWLKAEKMLDRHFRRKRTVIWSMSVFIIGLVIVSTTMVLHHFSGNVSPENQTQQVQEMQSSVLKQEHTLPMVNKENEINNTQDRQLKSSADERIKQSEQLFKGHSIAKYGPGKEKIEKKIANDKNAVLTQNNSQHRNNSKEQQGGGISNLQESSSQNPGNSKESIHNKNQEENVHSVSPADAKEFNDPVTGNKNNPNQMFHNEPELELLNPVYTLQVPFAITDQYSVLESRDENRNILLPGKKCDLKLFVYGTAQYIFKTLDSKNSTDYIIRRKKEEQGIITNSIGVSLSCEVKKFSTSIGIEYSSWGEKNMYAPYLIKKNGVENGNNQLFYRSITDTFYISGNQHPHTYQVADSMFVSHIDTVTTSTYDQHVSSVNGISKFYFIEVPVEFSYHCSFSRIGVGATVGISPAWLVSEKGSYLKKDLSGVETLSEIKSINRFIVNGRFSFDVYYRLNTQVNFVLRPQIKANLGSVFQREYDVNQRYYSAGLAFGLMYSIR